MSTTIKIREHGSYLIEGDDVTIVDWEGNAYPVERRPIALCRCGASARKPFCDGSHRSAGSAAACAPARRPQ
jgi:CDGSH-type Zn-finger protein